jgi:hypothetical protein
VTRSSGCLIVLGIPFAAAGAWAGVTAARLAQVDGFARMAALFACAAAVFGFVGFGLMASAVRNSRRARRDEELRTRNPEQPWMWNEEWVDRRISDQSRRGTGILWGFALLWNAMTLPTLYLLRETIAGATNPVYYAAYLFPVAGLLLILAAARLTLRAMRFPRSTLMLDSFPAPIGGTLHGSVHVPHPLANVTAVTVRLVALAHEHRGNTTTSSIVFDQQRAVPPGIVRLAADGVVIPVEIAIPSDAPPTSITGVPRQIFWRLSVDAELPGIDYKATFDVPVFHDRLAR